MSPTHALVKFYAGETDNEHQATHFSAVVFVGTERACQDFFSLDVLVDEPDEDDYSVYIITEIENTND